MAQKEMGSAIAMTGIGALKPKDHTRDLTKDYQRRYNRIENQHSMSNRSLLKQSSYERLAGLQDNFLAPKRMKIKKPRKSTVPRMAALTIDNLLYDLPMSPR